MHQGPCLVCDILGGISPGSRPKRAAAATALQQYEGCLPHAKRLHTATFGSRLMPLPTARHVAIHFLGPNHAPRRPHNTLYPLDSPTTPAGRLVRIPHVHPYSPVTHTSRFPLTTTPDSLSGGCCTGCQTPTSQPPCPSSSLPARKAPRAHHAYRPGPPHP